MELNFCLNNFRHLTFYLIEHLEVLLEGFKWNGRHFLFRQSRVYLVKKFCMHLRVWIVDGIEVNNRLGRPLIHQTHRHIYDLSSLLAELAITLSLITDKQKCYEISASMNELILIDILTRDS